MFKHLTKSIIFLLFTTNLFSGQEVFIYSKNTFNINGNRDISLSGKKYIVIDLDDGIGHFYAFNKNGSLYLKGIATGGTPSKTPTPEGIFNIIQMKKYHMSTLYPADDGNNNMNDMLKITKSGVALHKGSIDYYSHGCVHIEPSKSGILFNWADSNTKVVVTRDYFKEFMDSFN